MKRLRIFHLLSCLGIADANYYYRGMAGRGWMLEKYSMGFDCFIKRENVEVDRLFTFPVGSTELSEQDMEGADLKLLSMCTIGIIKICFLWGCIVDFLELRYIKRYNQLWRKKRWRYGSGVVLTYLANIAQLILIMIILCIFVWHS